MLSEKSCTNNYLLLLMWGAKEDYRVIGSSCSCIYLKSLHTPRWQSFNVASWFGNFCKEETLDHGSRRNGVWDFNKILGARDRIFYHELMPLGDWLSSRTCRNTEHGWWLTSGLIRFTQGPWENLWSLCRGSQEKVSSWLRSGHIARMGILSYLACSFQMHI